MTSLVTPTDPGLTPFQKFMASDSGDGPLFVESDFRRNCQRFGKELLDYLACSFAALGGMTEQEWRSYNGVPETFMPRVKALASEITKSVHDEAGAS